MTKSRLSGVGAIVACAGFIGAAGVWAAGDNKPSEFGRIGNKGEGFEKQDTIKGKGQNPESTINQDSQVTLGGARPVVEGRVVKVQGEDYLIRDASGSEVHLRVNKDTNMDCAAPSGQAASMSTGRHSDDQAEIPPTSHMQETMGQQQGNKQIGRQKEEHKGKQILQQNQQRQAKGQGGSQSSAESHAGMPSGHQAGSDEHTSNLDRNADLGKGTLGPHEGQTAQSRQYSAQGEHGQAGEQMEQAQHGGQQAEMSGERIGDQSGTQTRSTMGKDSGGDIARGSGFTIGSKGGCQFKAGDKVKAEVSDLGTVLSIKQISDRNPRQEQRASGQMVPDDSGLMPGHKAAAQQQAQRMQPGSVPAPADHQNPDVLLDDGKTAKAESQQQKDACEGCTRVRGKVVRNDHDTLVIKDKSQKEISLKLDERTRMGQVDPKNATFIEGDRIEAYVKDGRAWSVTQLKQQSNQPGVDAEGD
jgi:hypothetical protein